MSVTRNSRERTVDFMQAPGPLAYSEAGPSTRMMAEEQVERALEVGRVLAGGGDEDFTRETRGIAATRPE